MNERLQEIINTFDCDDDELRLELLLDYSRKLPELPERFHQQRDAGMHRVPECMTPVFLFMEQDDGNVKLYIDVAEEAPTVKGLMAIILDAFDCRPASEIASIPTDLLQQLQLHRAIRMQRAVGFSGILGRIRKQAGELADAA